jgi:hypothetical protein
LKFADDAQPGHPVKIVTEETVEQVGELIWADRRITIDNVATALGCSSGLAYSIMHGHLKFREVCAEWVPRELKDREKINRKSLSLQQSYGMQMKENVMLTRIVTGVNHGCVTTNRIKACFSEMETSQFTFSQKV